MRTLFFSLVLITGLGQLFAQQIELIGQVSMHNSRYHTGQIEYVAGTYVEAPYAGSTKSDANGHFSLVFQGIELGTVLELMVEKADLEVVNKHDLERVVLGRKSKLPVYLIPKRRLAKAQTELYNINKAALFARKNAIIARLEGNKAESDAVLAELEQDWGLEINSVSEAVALLESKVKGLEKRLPEFANELVRKNLDFASDLYIKAYEFFQAGDLEATIATLDDATLEKSYQDALASYEGSKQREVKEKELQENSLLQITQIVDGYKLRAKSLKLDFKYREAADTYVKIIEKLKEKPELDSLKLANAYNELSLVYRDVGQFDQALSYQLDALAISEPRLGDQSSNLARLRNNLATIYLNQGDFKNALLHQEKALFVLAQLSEPEDSVRTATAYLNLAVVYKGLDRNKEAIDMQEKALAIQKRILPANDSDIALSYSNLAAFYQALGQRQEALSLQEKALGIRKQILPPNHPDLATSYNNIASIYNDMQEQEKALDAQQKALNIQKQNQSGNPLNIALSYNNFAVIYQNLGKFRKALVCQDSAHVIFLEQLGATHPSTIKSYNNYGSIYYDLGEYQKCIEYFDQSFELKGMTELPYANTTGLAYLKLGNMEKAQQRFTRLQELLPNHFLPFRNWALYYCLNGEVEQALDNLELAYEKGYDNWEWLRKETALEPIREHQRFQALLAKDPGKNE